MEVNSSLLLLSATAIYFNFTDILRELRKAIPIICKPYHPVYVFIDQNQTLAQEPLLDQFFAEYNHPLSIVTQTEIYKAIPPESCVLLFLGNFTQVEKLRRWAHYESEHPRLIVTHVSYFTDLLLRFENSTLVNCVYFVHNESRYGIFHYDGIRDNLNRWTTIQSNPNLDVVQDLNGKKIFVHRNLPLEPIEMHLVRLFVTRHNGTLSFTKPARAWIIFNSVEHVCNDQKRFYVYTIRTTNYRALVPRLGEPQSMLDILLDPFDAATWLAYVAMIVSVAILRIWFSQLCTWKHLAKSIQDIFFCILFSSPRMFYRPMEQVAVGLFMLLNVVMLSAYESLVISFLLNPRFTPEIDTVKQFNEECCWFISTSVAVAARGPCWFNTNDVKANETLPLKYNDRYTCLMLQPRLREYWNETLSIPLVAQRYRWAKAVDNPQYVFGLVFWDIGVTEVLQKYVDVFFAEGALYKYFDRAEEDGVVTDKNKKAVHLDDLVLLWMCYFCGLAICTLVLVVEVVLNFAIKWGFCALIRSAIERCWFCKTAKDSL